MKVIIYTDGSPRSNPGRGGYGAVLKYNNRIMQVPTNIIAGMFHFEQAQYFQADEGSRQVPQVRF